MTVSDFTHQLIHSLSPAEKKFFKEKTGQADLGYVKLFDAINNQKEYNEAALKKKFANEKWAKNFSYAKNYLNENILWALRQLNAGKQSSDLSYDWLQNLKLLFERGFTSYVEKQLPKLKQYCNECELHGRTLEVLTFEATVNNILIKHNTSVYNERYHLLQSQLNSAEINQVYNQLMAVAVKFDNSDNPELNIEIERLVKNQKLKEENLNGTADELYALYNVFFVYHYLKRNFRESYLAKRKQFELYRFNKPFIHTYPKKYLMLLGNLVSMAYNNNDVTEFDEAFKETLNAHDNIKGFESLKFEQRISFGLLNQKMHNDASRLDELTTAFIEGMKKHQEQITLVRELDVCFNIAIANFRINRFDVSADWINTILNHSRIRERSSMEMLSKQFELFIQFELKNFSVLDYKISNLIRQLQKNQNITLYNACMLNGLKRLLKHIQQKTMKSEISKLLSELEKFELNEFDKTFKSQFDYIRWLKEKADLLK